MDLHPVILAGGRGSRMYPLAEECPKALLPVGNMPVIYYPIQLLEKNGFKGQCVDDCTIDGRFELCCSCNNCIGVGAEGVCPLFRC